MDVLTSVLGNVRRRKIAHQASVIPDEGNMPTDAA